MIKRPLLVIQFRDKHMKNTRKYSDVNPYDLNQVGKIRNSRSRIVGIRSRSDDPYSTSSVLGPRLRQK